MLVGSCQVLKRVSTCSALCWSDDSSAKHQSLVCAYLVTMASGTRCAVPSASSDLPPGSLTALQDLRYELSHAYTRQHWLGAVAMQVRLGGCLLFGQECVTCLYGQLIRCCTCTYTAPTPCAQGASMHLLAHALFTDCWSILLAPCGWVHNAKPGALELAVISSQPEAGTNNHHSIASST